MRGKKVQEEVSSSKKTSDKPAINSFKELDDVLKNSFGAIKEDMLRFKEAQHQQLLQLNETRQALSSKSDAFVTIDRFNVIKIKIGELNENMKKVWDLDKKLIEVDAKSLSESDFDKQASEWENDLEKLRQDIQETKEVAADEKQLNQLVQDINEEFDSIKYQLDDLRKIRDTITSGELEKRTNSLANEMEDIRLEFRKVYGATEDKVGSKQVESLISDLNKEFDDIKSAMDAMKEDLKDCCKRNELKTESAKIESNIQKIRADITDIKKVQKTLISKVQVKALVDDINKEFDELKTDIADSESDMKKFVIDTDKKAAQRMKKIESDASATKKDLNNTKKTYFTVAQAGALTDDINEEFDGTKADIKSTNSDLAVLRKEAMTKASAESRFKKIDKEFSTKDSELDELNKDINDFKGHSDRAFFGKAQAKALVKDVNKEFDGLKASIDDTNSEISSTRKVLSAKISTVSSNLTASKKEAESTYLKQKQAEELVNDLNAEFDILKKNMKNNSSDIDTLRKRTNKNLKNYVKKKDLNDELSQLKNSVAEIQAVLGTEVISTKKFNKINSYFKKSLHKIDSDYVSKDQYNGLVDEVNRLKALIKRKNIRSKDIAKVVAPSPKVAKMNSKKKVAFEKIKTAKEQVPYRKSYFLGNLLIIVAFVLLVASIVLFFLNQLALTDKIAIVSVGAFVLGLIIRIAVIIKRSRLVNA